ncbi:MAG: DUF501 domain-containing protein [Cloacibacillus sp.]
MKRENAQERPEEFSPPAFWSALTGSDLELLKIQRRGRKTDAAEVLWVARRCSHGAPQVIVSSPLSRDGSPFPTIFWLTCPYLNRRCGGLESAQKISELEKIFADAPEAARAMHHAYAALRMSLLTPQQREAAQKKGNAILSVLTDTGVGGINWKEALCGAKCLHLHTATWLGTGEHPAKAWLAEAVGPLECERGECMRAHAETA